MHQRQNLITYHLINPLHFNIIMNILYTTPRVLNLQSRISLVQIISLILVTLMRDSGYYCREKLEAGQS